MNQHDWTKILTFILVVGVLIGGGVFEIAGFAYVHRMLTYIVVFFLVAAPPIGTVAYLVYIIRRKLKP